MELDKLNKYVHITQLVDCVEVMFAGQPCLKIFETPDVGYYWRINPMFAKLTYGADVFNDVPYCSENFEMLEAAIAVGLEKLHELGAFNTEIDLPEDTYASEHLDESVEELDESEQLKKMYPVGTKDITVKGKMTGATPLGTSEPMYKDHDVKPMFRAHTATTKLSLNDTTGEVVGHHGDNVVVKTSIKEFGTDKFKHFLARSENIIGHKQKLKESEERIDELSNFVKGSYVVKAARNRDELDDRLTAIKDSGANVKTDKIEKKLKNREAGMQKVVSRIPKEVSYSIKEDCRREAMKHCDSLMEIQDLAQGLYESIVNEIKSDVVTAYDKEKTTNAAKTEAGKKSLYKQVVRSQKEPKTNQWKVKESVEELDEAYGSAKKAYDPFASAISKVMSRPAFSAITKDKPEEAPKAAKKGRPTNIDLDSIKSKAADNLKAGQRPTHGMERNEKIHFIRHLKDHPDFTGTHVSAAGRTHGTTKDEMEKRKETAKAAKVDNVMANWMKK